jgi:antitoxin ParD1/3/4
MPSMNISLPDELHALVQQKVASGLYGSASEVIREAIRSMNKNEQLEYEVQLSKLKQILAPALEQAARGEYVEFSWERLNAEIDRDA